MIIRSKAPLRIGLAGGGTDVSPFCDLHGGCVLNVTINMFSYCTIIPKNNGRIVFIAPDRNTRIDLEAKGEIELNDDLILHRGIYNRIVKEFNGGTPLSFEMTTYSDAPVGSGLGTSSTMVVAILKAYQEWLNLPLGEYDLAQLAYDIERRELKLMGGKQDQYAATFGGLNFMEFYENDRVIVNPLKLKNWIKNEVQNSMVLYYTGTSRDSGKIIEEQTKATKSEHSLNGMKEIKEQAYKMKEHLLKGEFSQIAECLNKGWQAKKKTASVISNQFIDETYDYIMQNGAKAAKISGAGGGGFMMIWCDPQKRYELIRALKSKSEGKAKVIDFVESGAQAWTIYDKEE